MKAKDGEVYINGKFIGEVKSFTIKKTLTQKLFEKYCYGN